MAALNLRTGTGPPLLIPPTMTARSRHFSFLWFWLALAVVPAASAQRIRIVAGNISSGNGQDYNPGHGIRIFQGVKPDIILIQEFNYLNNSVDDLKSFVNTIFGNPTPATFPYFYFRETNTGSIPNGVISRYPILESGQWVSTVTQRDYSWARIDLPGARELLAVSVHLPTTDSAQPAEALDLVGYVNSYYAANGGARATDYLVIGGDFNSDSRSATCLNASHLGQIVTTTGTGVLHPKGDDGLEGTNASRAKPYDGVYAGKGLHALQVPTVIGASGFPNGLVADTRVYNPISELAPAFAADSGADQMQHMAVVKDFQIPVPVDPAVLEILSSSLKSTAPREVRMTFRSTTGAVYEVHASESMAAASWTTLGSVTAAGTSTSVVIVPGPPGAGQVQDSLLAGAARRFYRVIRR